MTSGLIVALIGLIVVITLHIVVIARWSGQIDGYVKANNERMLRQDVEVQRLRDARHETDGKVQRLIGQVSEIQRLFDRRVQGAEE